MHDRKLQGRESDSTAVQQTRQELVRVINEQFEVRTELRRRELERIERQTQRLHDALERVRQESLARIARPYPGG